MGTRRRDRGRAMAERYGQAREMHTCANRTLCLEWASTIDEMAAYVNHIQLVRNRQGRTSRQMGNVKQTIYDVTTGRRQHPCIVLDEYP